MRNVILPLLALSGLVAAALPAADKLRVVAERAPNLGVVSAYNDMLSAHQPYETWPALLREEARRHGATAQVAG